MPQQTRDSGFTFAETYQLYNEQLHYARATYARAQLDRWQLDWNAYFVKHGMEIPPYAHKVAESKAQPGAAGSNGATSSSTNLLAA